MSKLYPTLEDLKVHQIQEAQVAVAQQASANNQSWYPQQYTPSPAYPATPASQGQGQPQQQQTDLAQIYPSLMQEYMGLRLEPPTGPLTFPTAPAYPVASGGPQQGQGTPQGQGAVALKGQMVVAPLTEGNLGAKRGNVTNFIREVFCCKDQNGRFGLRLKDVDKGIFVQFVEKGSPASLSGLRFGDQILQINGQNVAGMTSGQVFKLLSKWNMPRVSFIVRDRPFERSITLHKDSRGHVGFTHDDGLIKAIVQDSSAARNGLLVDHYVLEINGQNVVGLKSKELAEIISKAGQVITLTVIPRQIYEHIMKHMSGALVKQLMDRSIPEIY